MKAKVDKEYKRLQDKIAKTRGNYQFAQKKAAKVNNAFYSLRSILGYNWPIFFILLGGR